MHRHARQSRLPEIGPAGQARLARAQIDVPLTGFAGDVAVRYLAGAGVGRLRVADGSLVEEARAVDPAVVVEVAPDVVRASGSATVLSDGPCESVLRHATARDLARGAVWALGAIRAALAEDGSGRS
jgi:hypothetical protein